MRQKHIQGWRFVHPDFDAVDEAPGLQLTSRGTAAMVEGDAAVRQAISMLLSTTPGERVMLPQYGCSLDHLMFLPNDDTTAGLAMHYVRQALERWEPRIQILRLDAAPDPYRPERLSILLEYRVRSTQRDHQLTMAVDLGDEQT